MGSKNEFKHNIFENSKLNLLLNYHFLLKATKPKPNQRSPNLSAPRF